LESRPPDAERVKKSQLVEGDLPGRWIRRRRKRMLDELDHHVIVCGYGRMGPSRVSSCIREAR
jgi:hypothetical protein